MSCDCITSFLGQPGLIRLDTLCNYYLTKVLQVVVPVCHLLQSNTDWQNSTGL